MLAVEFLVATECEMFSIKDLNSYSVITTAIWEPDFSIHNQNRKMMMNVQAYSHAVWWGVESWSLQRMNKKEIPFIDLNVFRDFLCVFLSFKWHNFRILMKQI